MKKKPEVANAGPPQAADELKQALWSPGRLYLQAGWLSLVIGVLILAPSAYMFEVYGRVLNSRNAMTLAWLVVAAVGIYVVLELLELARLRILRRAAQEVSEQMSPRVLDATFDAGLKRIAGVGPQALADLRQVTDFIPSPAVTAALDLPASALCLLLLFAMSPYLGTLALLLAVGQVLIAVYQERRSSRPFGEANRASAMAQHQAAGILRNAQVVESMGMARALHKRWAGSQGKFMLGLAQASDKAGSANAATKVLTMAQSSLLLGLAAVLALQNQLNGGPGMVIVASILGGRVMAPMAQFIGQWRVIGNARSAYGRLARLLQTLPPQSPGMPLPEPKGVLTAEHLLVNAPGSSTPILRGVSLHCKPGQLLAIVGPSGGGKTTLARALVGLWPSSGGKVRLDGADVYDWHKSQLGQHVGYLAQGVELFDGTVAENIARFDKVDPQKLEQAVQDAGLTDLVAGLPNGLDTRIGDEGVLLSGGQRQRVGLARAVYGQPRLVVLDEPNASLDDAGDKALMALLQQLKAKGATVVVITHRNQVLALADNLLVLADGAVAKFGPRDEVLAALRAASEKQAGAARPPGGGAPANPAPSTRALPGMATGGAA